MFTFDEVTDLAAIGPGMWRGEISAIYNVGVAPNGGYLMALAAKALSQDLPHPHPFTVTAHYLRRPSNDSVDISTEVIRTGRTLSTGMASLIQDGREVVRVLATFGDHDAADGPNHMTASPPDLPPPEDLVSSVGVPTLPDVAKAFDHRLTPQTMGFAFGIRTERAEIEGYTRFLDDRPVDPISLLLIADALPPPVLNVVELGWVPTIELTVHVRAVPVPGWLSYRFRTRALVEGYLDEDGEIWDSAGRLVAMSRQIALALPPTRQGLGPDR